MQFSMHCDSIDFSDVLGQDVDIVQGFHLIESNRGDADIIHSMINDKRPHCEMNLHTYHGYY